MFITLFLGIVDTDKNTLTYSRAGHEPGLLLRASAESNANVETLRGEGMAIGMVPNELFEEIVSEQTCSFEEGDALVLFTDGVTETTNQHNEEYSLARLIAKLEKFGGGTANSFNEELLGELEKFADQSNDRDDVTIITARKL